MTNNVRRGLGLLVVAVIGVVLLYIGFRISDVAGSDAGLPAQIAAIAFMGLGLLAIVGGVIAGLVMLAVGLLSPQPRR